MTSTQDTNTTEDAKLPSLCPDCERADHMIDKLQRKLSNAEDEIQELLREIKQRKRAYEY